MPRANTHPTRRPVRAFDHPHHGLEAGHIGAVAGKGFVAQGTTLDIHDHGEDDRQAIRPMITAVPAAHHRILGRGAFDVAAREVVQHDVELRREQLAVARGEMALERGLVRQHVIERAIQPAVVNRPVGNM